MIYDLGIKNILRAENVVKVLLHQITIFLYMYGRCQCHYISCGAFVSSTDAL